MDLNFVLELLFLCLCITELLALDSTKLLKFPGFQCNETSGSAVEGLYDGQCIGRALQDACWAFRVCPDCQCCETVMKATDNSTFLYSPAHRQEGTQCIMDSQCSESNKCLSGICSNGALSSTTVGTMVTSSPGGTPMAATTPSSGGSCLSGWQMSPDTGKCYFYYGGAKVWQDAQNHCASLTPGANLASIHSAVEATFVRGLAGGAAYWVGATDAANEGTWVWTDGTPFDFPMWWPASGSNGPAYNCAYVTSTYMYDEPCSPGGRSFVCKSDPI